MLNHHRNITMTNTTDRIQTTQINKHISHYVFPTYHEKNHCDTSAHYNLHSDIITKVNDYTKEEDELKGDFISIKFSEGGSRDNDLVLFLSPKQFKILRDQINAV